jgi:ectonucleoside triphosphate diphosphohydrolase 5/6
VCVPLHACARVFTQRVTPSTWVLLTSWLRRSTGSRIHIYKFRPTAEGQLLLDSEIFRHIEPGLSSYHADPPAGARSLIPLLDEAVQAVPKAQQHATPINLKATAGTLLPLLRARVHVCACVRACGCVCARACVCVCVIGRVLCKKLMWMLLRVCKFLVHPFFFPLTPHAAGLRLLPASEADAILFEVRALLRRYPFFYDQKDAVEVMDGDSEGLFGWVTVNYLRNSLGLSAERTAAVLDLGGGSTQIALSVGASESVGVSLKKTSVMGRDHNMYIYSHLGYGLMAGRMGVLTHAVPASDPRRQGKAPLAHRCFHPGTKVSYAYGSDKVEAVGETDAGFEGCMAAATAFVKRVDGSFQQTASAPAPAAGQPVVAMSYYFDRAIDAGLIPATALHAELRPSLYRDAARRICALTPEAVGTEFPHARKRAEFMCIDLCFISALLEDGFGLHTHAPILLAKKMEYNGELVETAWSLGASIAEISETREQLNLS